MVQRKPGLQADPQKPPSPHSLQEPNFKIKKSRSMKISDMEPQNHNSKSVSRSILPNYMKSTSSSAAKKEQQRQQQHSQVSAQNPINTKRRSLGSCKKEARTSTKCSSLRYARTLMKTHSFKPHRASSKVVLCDEIDLQRATCSSTLKDSKFPDFLKLSHGGTEAQGTSAMKVCPYLYCSLNGHHHSPLPPLKTFLKAKRRLLKTQKSLKKIEAVEMEFLVEIDGQVAESLSDGSPRSEVGSEEVVGDGIGFGREDEKMGGFWFESGCGDESEAAMEEEGVISETFDFDWNEVEDIDDLKVGFSVKSRDDLDFDGEFGIISDVDVVQEHEGAVLPKVVNEVTYQIDEVDEVEDIDNLKVGFSVESRDDLDFDGEFEIISDVDVVQEPEVTVLPKVVSEETDKIDDCYLNLYVDGIVDQNTEGSDEVMEGCKQETKFEAEHEVDEQVIYGIKIEFRVKFENLDFEGGLENMSNVEVMQEQEVIEDESQCFDDMESTPMLVTSAMESQPENGVIEIDIEVKEGEVIHESDRVLSKVASEVTDHVIDSKSDEALLSEVTDHSSIADHNEKESNENLSKDVSELTVHVASSKLHSNSIADQNEKKSHIALDHNQETELKAKDGDSESKSPPRVQNVEKHATIKTSQDHKDRFSPKPQTSPEQPPATIDTKWSIGNRKIVNEGIEDTSFNPREPNYLPLVPNQETEKIDLKHQMIDERRNGNEWMLDYALQQTVTKLAPARKRKVALLVEAFESVLPMPSYEAPPRHGFALARPIQACN